jgi:hypothetical protein
MKRYASALRAATVTCALFATAACSDDEKMDANPGENTGGSSTAPPAGSDQLPPHGYTAISAWLSDGDYMDWACEPAVHEARSPSPHGFNRICSNDVLAADATSSTDWRKGAAAVKELHASVDGTEPIGYAVYEKTKDDSAGGANWYWYEIIPVDSPIPHDANGVVADGLADKDGPELQICVGCHMAAGSDAIHTPSVGGRDQVYTPVAP